MSTVKISQLPEIDHLNTNTDETLVVGVDTVTGATGKITVTTLAEGLYSNNALKVGSNQVQGANVIAQFTGNSSIYLQTVIQNFDGNGSSDMVATAGDGDDTSRYVDVGINGKDFADPAYSAMKPYDAYLYSIGYQADSQTGNLVIGTGSTEADIVLIAGGTESANIVGRINKHEYAFYKDLTVTGNTTVTGHYTFADGSLQTVAYDPNVDVTQNTRIQSLETNNVNQNNSISTINTAISVIQGVDSTQNTEITNNSANTVYLQGALNTANANSVLNATTAQNAYNKANNALANTTGTFAGNLNVSGFITLNTAGGIYQETASPSVMTANTTGNFQIVTNRSLGPRTFGFGQNGTLSLPGNITVNGTMVLANSNFSNTESAVTISATPTVALPSNDGYMLHISGKDGVPSRIVYDSYGAGAYAVVAGRTARGSVASPTAVSNNDVLMRVSGNGHGGGANGWTQFGVARIDIVATEDYTATNRGSQIQFWNCPVGSNTLQQIATFNGNSVEFTGVIKPEKGFVLTPNVISANVTSETIDFSRDSLKKHNIINDCTITLTNFTAGKLVEMWVTNLSGSNRVVTHGVSALNSTTNATTVTLPATSSAYFKYFSIDGDLANTFVAITHA